MYRGSGSFAVNIEFSAKSDEDDEHSAYVEIQRALMDAVEKLSFGSAIDAKVTFDRPEFELYES